MTRPRDFDPRRVSPRNLDVLILQKGGRQGSQGLTTAKLDATNDIGIISLPDGAKLAVAAFLSGSKLLAEDWDRLIANVVRLAVNSAALAGMPVSE